jgi:class 3 adenylate cyclase
MKSQARGPKQPSGWLKGLNIALLLPGLLLCALAINPLCKLFFAWELDTLTIRQKWNPPAYRGQKTPITLVSVDSKTMGNPVIHHLFGSGFSRPAAAYAVRFFNRTHPRMIIFDAGFNGGIHEDDLTGDHLFAQSILPKTPVASALIFENEEQPARLSPLVLKRIQNNALGISGLSGFPALQQNEYNQLNPPYPELLASPMRFFASNSSVFKANLDKTSDDTSGYSRRWMPIVRYQGNYYPSLALGALLYGETKLSLSHDGQLRWKGATLDLGTEGVPLIKWHGHGVNVYQPVYPEVPFADMVLSEIAMECREKPTQAICATPGLPHKPVLSPQAFTNRYVLTGFTYANSVDEHVTIYGSKYPGVYIVANTLDNALHNEFVRPAPFWMNLLPALILPLILLGLALRFQSPAISVMSLLSLSLLHFMFCLKAYQDWNLWIYCIYPLLSLLACFTGLYVYRYTREFKRRQQMHYAFGKYVSPAVLQIIETHPEQVTLGGERREMTFLFADIRGFTAFADHNSPEVVQGMLTQYFSRMNNIIMHQYQGSINKLIGDAIMAYWGFPLRDEDHALLAVSAALTMQQAMAEWRKQSQELTEGQDHLPPLYMGIGIHTGDAMVGNVGSEDFMDFTVIGDAVNVASRLESATKEHHCDIIISAATYAQVKDRIQVRSLGWAELKGKSERMEIFEPRGFIKENES